MIQGTDLFIVERGGVLYKLTADQISTFVGVVKEFTATDYTNLLSGTYVGGGVAKVGDKVFVIDASGSPDVGSGWALYRVDSIGTLTHTKLAEQESMDFTVVSASNLSYDNATRVVSNDNGSGFTIPVVNETNHGLATPTMFTNSHEPTTKVGNATVNPINISASQELSFSITQLTALP